MYQKNISEESIPRSLIIIVLALVCIASTFVILEKTGITNFYETKNTPIPTSQQNTSEVPSAEPTNTIDYSGPKTENASVVPAKNPNPSPVTPINPELSAIITNSRKSGDLYLIKAVISGTDSATCSAVMTKGSLIATGSSGASDVEGQYSCKDLSIPLSQLTENGEWNLELTVTDKAGATASTSTKVIL